MSEVPIPTSCELPKLFEDGKLYTVVEITEILKCGKETVYRHVKKHGLRSIRFGATKFFGRDLNELILKEVQA